MRKIRRTGAFGVTNTYLSSGKLRGTSCIRGLPESHQTHLSALCSSTRNFSCIGNNRILLVRGRGGVGGVDDGNDLKTSPDMMTPLGHDAHNDEDVDTSKKTDGNRDRSQYRIFDKLSPKTSSEWVQVALSIRGKDEKVLVCVSPEKVDPQTADVKIDQKVVRFVTTNENEGSSEEGALATLSYESSLSPSHQSAAATSIHILEQESTDSVTGEKMTLLYTPMTRLECMLTALRNDILSLFPSVSGEKVELLSAENSQSRRNENVDLSNHWNMLGGMFNSKVPFVRVLKNLDTTRTGTNALTLTPLLCYTRAVELRPDSANAWNNLGAEIAQNGLVEGQKLKLRQHNSEISADACFCFTKAVELKPDYVSAWFNLFLCDKPSVSLLLPQPALVARVITTTDPTIENYSETKINVSRDDCYVKALTAAREDSYSLFLTGKGLLELPASRGGHFSDYVETHNGLRVAREPFNVEKAIVKVLEEAIRSSSDFSVGESNSNGRERDVCALQFDSLALWYYAAECLEYKKDQRGQRNRRESDAPDAEAERTFRIAGSEYTAKGCLVSALEVEARRQASPSAASTKGSPFIPLVWEALSKHVKGDGTTVTIAGHTFTAEEVFTNQFES